MFTEIARGVAGGVAELFGGKSQGQAVRPRTGAEAKPEPVDESVAGSVAAEVEIILEAAQESASRILADAREEAGRILADARREAAVIEETGGPEVPEAPVDEPTGASAGSSDRTPDTAPDEAAIRLVAMNLALNGAQRPEIVTRVEADFGSVPGLDAILDDVLARTG